MTRRPRLAERRCCLVATLETDWQRSTRYWGAWLCRQLNTMSLSLNATHSGTLEQDVLVLHGFMLIYLTYRISRDIILSTDSQIFINTLCVISSEFRRYEFDDCNWNAVNAVLIVFEWASEWWLMPGEENKMWIYNHCLHWKHSKGEQMASVHTVL